ncbi:MAG: hypothetical protein J5701_05385 [Bacteroidales bacterium]|nr:hypothetical protein [Bacteroidales bacterium]
MKKIISVIALSLCCVLIANTTMAGGKKTKTTVFQGEVKYAIKYSGDIDPQKLAQLPTESTYKVMGNKRKTTMNVGFPLHVIYDGDACKLIQLIDYPGQQMAIVREKAYFDEAREGVVYSYTPTNDTKTICGYVCNGYKITVTNTEEEESREVGVAYTSTELVAGTAGNFFELPGLDGFPMYIQTTSANGVSSTTSEVTAINTKVKINPADFLIPSSFKILTDEEIEQLFGGGNGDDDDF